MGQQMQVPRLHAARGTRPLSGQQLRYVRRGQGTDLSRPFAACQTTTAALAANSGTETGSRFL